MPYTKAKFIPQTGEYRCGISECNALLFKGEIAEARIEKKCKCGVINVVEVPVRKYGSYQDNLNLTRK